MKVIIGKLVVVGHPGVGKTSTVIRYIERTFNTEVSSTIGASYFNCKMEIEDILVKFQIWDTAGQERFKAMVPMFYRNANAALLVFDITKRESFDSIKVWVNELKKNIQEKIVMFVVGNKTDLPDRQVSKEEALQYSHSIGATYYECSAKEDQVMSLEKETKNCIISLLDLLVQKKNNKKSISPTNTKQTFTRLLLPFDGTAVIIKTLGIQQIFLGLARAVIQLSGTEVAHNLKVLDASSCRALVADASDANATDIGRTEVPSWSINSLAHGEVQKSGCC